MRRRTLPAACAYATLVFFVVAPDAQAATDLNTVIDNLKLWLTGLLASLATVFLITGGRPLRDGGRRPDQAGEGEERDLERRPRLRLRALRTGDRHDHPEDRRRMSRAPRLLLAAARDRARARPAGARRSPHRRPPRRRPRPRPRPRRRPGSGIQVGPPPPPSSGTPRGGGTVDGDQASHPHFWDLPGRIRQSIDDWFKGLVLDALNPTLDLVGKTVLATPQLAEQRAGGGTVADQPDRRRRAAGALRARRGRPGDEPRDDAEPLRAQGPRPPPRSSPASSSTPASASAAS